MKLEAMDKTLNGKTSPVRRPARERLLAAAEELFYQDGVQRVGIETKLALQEAPPDKMLAVFDAMTEPLAKRNYRGCAFLRATAEMAADASGREVCRNARRWTRELLSGLAKEAGASNPDVLAKQLVLLYDGAAASAQMDRDPAAAAEARAAAVLLIDAACAKRVRSRA